MTNTLYENWLDENQKGTRGKWILWYSTWIWATNIKARMYWIFQRNLVTINQYHRTSFYHGRFWLGPPTIHRRHICVWYKEIPVYTQAVKMAIKDVIEASAKVFGQVPGEPYIKNHLTSRDCMKVFDWRKIMLNNRKGIG